MDESCSAPAESEAIRQVGMHEGMGSFNPRQIAHAIERNVSGIRIPIPALSEQQRAAVSEAIGEGSYEKKPEMLEFLRTEVRAEAHRVDPEGVVEYSTNRTIAEAFSRSAGSVVVTVEIDPKYLIRGSGSESGWICYNCAPCRIIDR